MSDDAAGILEVQVPTRAHGCPRRMGPAPPHDAPVADQRLLEVLLPEHLRVLGVLVVAGLDPAGEVVREAVVAVHGEERVRKAPEELPALTAPLGVGSVIVVRIVPVDDVAEGEPSVTLVLEHRREALPEGLLLRARELPPHVERVAPQHGAPPVGGDSAFARHGLGEAEVPLLHQVADQLPDDPGVLDLPRRLEEPPDQTSAGDLGLRSLRREILLLVSAEPDADPPDALVTRPVGPFRSDRDATLTKQLEIPLTVPGLVDEVGRVSRGERAILGPGLDRVGQQGDQAEPGQERDGRRGEGEPGRVAHEGFGKEGLPTTDQAVYTGDAGRGPETIAGVVPEGKRFPGGARIYVSLQWGGAELGRGNRNLNGIGRLRLAASLARYMPARRASRTDPLEALRSE